MSTRQLHQADFGAVLPEEVDWQPFPSLPPAARLHIGVGEQFNEGQLRAYPPGAVVALPGDHAEHRAGR